MRSEDPPTPDWRDGEAYAPLLDVDRAGFAWEWLRRDGGYRQAAANAFVRRQGMGPGSPEAGAACWGLHRFEPPERDALIARPVWRRNFLPLVLEAGAAEGGAPGERFDLARLKGLATLIAGPAGEHLLLSDGRRSIRLDIVAGTLGSGPVLLDYRLAGLGQVQPALRVLRQLLALWSLGRFSAALHPREPRARRWTLVLRAHDALVAGATQRDIAAVLLGRDAAAPRWRIEAPSLRSRAQRLVRDARRMAQGGYLALLSGRTGQGRDRNNDG